MKRWHLLSSITEKSVTTIEQPVCLKCIKKRNLYLMKSKVKVRCYGNKNPYKCHVMVICTVPKVLCSYSISCGNYKYIYHGMWMWTLMSAGTIATGISLGCFATVITSLDSRVHELSDAI